MKSIKLISSSVEKRKLLALMRKCTSRKESLVLNNKTNFIPVSNIIPPMIGEGG